MLTDYKPALTPLDEDVIIQLDNVSVRYRVPRERISGIKEFAIRWVQRQVAYEEFYALRDISFQVRRGEVFGVIGRNGSGKSTMLKVIAHVLHPKPGRILTRGKVAPLLELGAGFHAELTGRENVFLNSALLGLTRQEVEELLPEIIDFAEIGDFMEAPLRTYSTGMVARLGFAVATCVRPEILLVDEVLSVGDGQFQRKCLDRMYSFQQQGTTIAIVSHSMATIETFCDRALWLVNGKARAIGPVADVIDQYVHMDQPGQDTQKGEKFSEFTHLPRPDLSKLIARKDFTSLSEIGEVYPAPNILNVEEGSVSGWLRFQGSQPYPDLVIFHTDDSRFVIYYGSYFSENLNRRVGLVVARAGGNRRALDTYFGRNSFPEVSYPVDHAEQAEEDQLEVPIRWILVTMTWSGYPLGTVSLYWNGKLVGEKQYGRQHSDGRNLPSCIAVGMRPRNWAGEILQDGDGKVVDLRPPTILSALEAGLEIRDLRLYKRKLSPDEIEAIFTLGHPDIG